VPRPLPLRPGLLALSLASITLPAWAGDDCDAPVSRWQTREAVRQMAAQRGWQIQRLKIDDGCYEIRGTDVQGRAFKARLDPETLMVLKIRQGDHRRDRERERDREGAARQLPPPSPDGASAPSPASTPDTAPPRRTE
jgi:hypothetical protein